MTAAGCMALLGGVIWEKAGPQWVFIVFVLADAFIRIPLLITIPETLHNKFDSAN